MNISLKGIIEAIQDNIESAITRIDESDANNQRSMNALLAARDESKLLKVKLSEALKGLAHLKAQAANENKDAN